MATTNALLKAIKDRLDAMEPKRRQNLVKGVLVSGVVLFLVALYYMTGQDQKQPPPPKEAAALLNLGDARLEDDMRATQAKDRDELDAQNRRQDGVIQDAKEKIAQQDAQIKAMQGVLDSLAQGPALGLPDVPTKKGPGSSTNPLDWNGGAPLPPPTAGGVPVAPGTPPAAPPPVEYVGGVGIVKGAAPAKDDSKKKTRRFYLPPSFMPAKLLTGLAAKTVESAQSDPEPIMLRVQAPAVLPNEVRAQLEGCLVVGHGFGSLASERVEARLVSISCMDFDGKSMIDSELRGIVVDKDGVKGLAGHPVSKMGTNLARLAFAGALQGAGSAFSAQSTTISTSPLGQTQSINPSQIGKVAAGRGVENAADEYARIIADLVRQQSPVIEVGPSKDVTVVVTEGTWLSVKDYEDLPSE